MKQIILNPKDIARVFATDEMETYTLRGINVAFEQASSSGCAKSNLGSLQGLMQMPTSGKYQSEVGQQQRSAITRALVNKPALLLTDGATDNLEYKDGDAAMDMLQQSNKVGTALSMLANAPYVTAMATQKLHLLDGRIVDRHQASPVVAIAI
jgi:predicted ABC-type transport system involved in lysophospholipase L1 biosynthesis ATPase subunit